MTNHPALKRDLASFGLVVAWSGGFIGAELGSKAGADPFTLLAWRFLLLSPLLLVICAATRTTLRGWHLWRHQLVAGLFSQVIYLGLVFLGVHYGVHGGTSALIAALQPMLVMTVAGRFLGERTTAKGALGTIIGLVGVTVVVSGDIHAGHASAPMYLLPTIAMLALATGTVYSRKHRGSETLLQAITVQSILAGFSFTILAIVTSEMRVPENSGTWIAIIWLIIVPSLGGYGLYVFVTREFGATVVSTLLYLTPPTTMVWAWILFRDPITIAGIIGLMISGAGVALVLKERRSATQSR